jgi:hypothetical protein
MGEPVQPQVKHAPIIDDTLTDLAGFRTVPLQGLVANPTIFRGLSQR